MLLVRVQPKKLAEHWAFIKLAIASATPPNVELSEELMLRILCQLLAGKMQVWVANRKDVFPAKAIALLTTSLVEDEVTGARTLLIFSLYGWEPISEDEYRQGLETLAIFAKAENCTCIAFYTIDPNVIKMAEAVGFMTEFRYGVIRLV